ncbi:MAG TPA: TrkA family potassium uptake protein [Candidatus Limnocylindrales bacterium]|nr:TrkA family potassium uptake protein [Candidatus Limnocylindrales bacterium]
MRVVIVGCGRVGAGLAERLAGSGHEVTILDVSSDAFRRLPSDFGGSAVRGDGTDEDVLRRAGAEGADAFFALTEGDNRNVLAAQLAGETLGIPTVVAKVNDPVRAETYSSLGLATLCRTTLLVDALLRYLELPGVPDAVGVRAPTGSHHPDGRADHEALGGARTVVEPIGEGAGPSGSNGHGNLPEEPSGRAGNGRTSSAEGG